MSWEQRNADFCNAQTDAQMAYIEAEREVDRLQTENAKLRELLAGAFEDMVAWQRVIACSNEWGYGRGCREQLFELRDAMRDLGVEVDFDGR